ncbi:MAG TPA: RNA-binding S4 domain-containing protein [Thermoanaerobaculia bacterium]|jgi:ribosome-associated heat shock protein Hsp15|nr:RNA-binding S4 domain-containing protein [Thermoanaerobaculia bacterium]
MSSVRLDKWLQVARMYKTRTKATDACDLGRVKVNGQPAKPHRNLAVGDRVELEQGDWERVLIVKELKDRPGPKAEAANLYEDLSPPRPVLDPLERLMRRPPVLREAGAGRPTKKDRRDMERFGEPNATDAAEDDDLDF